MCSIEILKSFLNPMDNQVTRLNLIKNLEMLVLADFEEDFHLVTNMMFQISPIYECASF
jgi:hypothetical protein